MLELLKRYKITAICFIVGIIFLTLGVAQLFSFNTQFFQKPVEIKRISEGEEKNQSDKKSVEIYQNESSTATGAATIKVDVSGAVVNPGVYEVPSGSRINVALESAGGVSKKGDYSWISKNLNLATKLQDGDKVFIPAVGDIKPVANSPVLKQQEDPKLDTPQIAGVTTYHPGIQKSPATSSMPEPSPSDVLIASDGKISINTASSSELDTLPGIGPVTAKKIIDNRPYSALEEVKEKKAVNKSTYEKIKEKIKL